MLWRNSLRTKERAFSKLVLIIFRADQVKAFPPPDKGFGHPRFEGKRAKTKSKEACGRLCLRLYRYTSLCQTLAPVHLYDTSYRCTALIASGLEVKHTCNTYALSYFAARRRVLKKYDIPYHTRWVGTKVAKYGGGPTTSTPVQKYSYLLYMYVCVPCRTEGRRPGGRSTPSAPTTRS